MTEQWKQIAKEFGPDPDDHSIIEPMAEGIAKLRSQVQSQEIFAGYLENFELSVSRTRAANARLRAALEIYADEKSWAFGRITNLGRFVGMYALGKDGGFEVARKALAMSDGQAELEAVKEACNWLNIEDKSFSSTHPLVKLSEAFGLNK